MACHLASVSPNGKAEKYSLNLLDMARDAAEAAKNPRGSEHFRQRASALLHLGAEDDAKKYFLLAMQAMRTKNEARDENHVEMTGNRHLNLLGGSPNWDGAQELLSKVGQTFGKQSLEYAININYTAAAGLLTDSGAIQTQAISLLDASAADAASPFGRQATVTKLLSMTARLSLSSEQKVRWVRQALRANACEIFNHFAKPRSGISKNSILFKCDKNHAGSL